jgi:hypothetical protein
MLREGSPVGQSANVIAFSPCSVGVVSPARCDASSKTGAPAALAVPHYASSCGTTVRRGRNMAEMRQTTCSKARKIPNLQHKGLKSFEGPQNSGVPSGLTEAVSDPDWGGARSRSLTIGAKAQTLRTHSRPQWSWECCEKEDRFRRGYYQHAKPASRLIGGRGQAGFAIHSTDGAASARDGAHALVS